IAAAFAVLLTQQAAPHPSTQLLYQPPAIRPFEPPSDFGRETAEGDGGDVHRRPLEAPVKVEAYVRSYEVAPADAERAYEQGVASAEIRADQSAGPLDGYWRAVDGEGKVRFDLVLSDAGGLVEGGWRGPDGAGVATVDGGTLRLDGLGVVALERDGAGWRGRLGGGRGAELTLSRPR